MTSSSAASAAGLGSDEAYAEAMHAILSSEPCRGLVTEPTRLLTHVFIGSQANAEDLTNMRRLGISHVLNCAGYKGPRPSPSASPYDGLGIDYYEFKVDKRVFSRVPGLLTSAALHCLRLQLLFCQITSLSSSSSSSSTN